MFRLIIVSYCELYRRLRLLAFVNIADGSFIVDLLVHGRILFTLVE